MASYYGNQAQDNRTRLLQRGDQLNQGLQDQVNSRYGAEQGYTGTADQLYNNLQNQPGYSSTDQANILGLDRLNNLQLTPEQQQSNYLTQNEQDMVQGDPNKVLDYVPTAGVNQATNDLGENIAAAEGRQTTGMSNAYSDLASNTRAAIDPSKLGLSGDYTSSQANALKSGAAGVRGAAYNPNLDVSQEYNQNYQFGPKDQAEMALGAEGSVGTATRAKQEDVARAAAAAGGQSPMALAAAYDRLSRTGDVNAADAALNARIQAKQLGLDVTQGRENTRQAAVGRNAALQVGGEENIQGAALGASGQQEALRQGAQQYITGTTLGNETNLGQTNLANQQYYGTRDIAAAQNLANTQLSGQEYLGTTGLGAAQYADTNAASRAAAVAGNRQSTNQYNQGSTFQRGTYADTNAASRYSQVANQALAGQQEARGYYTGQGRYEGQMGAQAQGQQAGLYGTEYGLANQATGQAAGIENAQKANSFGGAFQQGFGGALGKLAGGGNIRPPTP